MIIKINHKKVNSQWTSTEQCQTALQYIRNTAQYIAYEMVTRSQKQVAQLRQRDRATSWRF